MIPFAFSHYSGNEDTPSLPPAPELIKLPAFCACFITKRKYVQALCRWKCVWRHFHCLCGSPKLEEKQCEDSEIRFCVVLFSRRFQSRRTSKDMERALLLHVGAGRTPSAGNMHFPLSHYCVFGMEVKRDLLYQTPNVPDKLRGIASRIPCRLLSYGKGCSVQALRLIIFSDNKEYT